MSDTAAAPKKLARGSFASQFAQRFSLEEFTSSQFPTLFTPVSLGKLQLQNRFALAPMTRARGTPDALPNNLIRDFYAQFDSTGLIITEGVHISPTARGWVNVPGLWNKAQVEAWKPVTAAVHANDGVIFTQIWHQGRTAHSSLIGGKAPFAPSAVKLQTTKVSSEGDVRVEAEVPHAMTKDDIKATIEEFRVAALNAVEAGFDGVEIHSANGYLLNEFLDSTSNVRTDEYGGSVENRFRFVGEVLDAVIAAIGKERVGIKFSPNGLYNEMGSPDFREQYLYTFAEVGKRDIAYVHVQDGLAFGFHEKGAPITLKEIRPLLPKSIALIGNCGYTPETAEAALAAGDADLISFGRPYLGAPDFPLRVLKGFPLAPPPEHNLWYNPTEEYKTGKGYIIPKFTPEPAHEPSIPE